MLVSAHHIFASPIRLSGAAHTTPHQDREEKTQPQAGPGWRAVGSDFFIICMETGKSSSQMEITVPWDPSGGL